MKALNPSKTLEIMRWGEMQVKNRGRETHWTELQTDQVSIVIWVGMVTVEMNKKGPNFEKSRCCRNWGICPACNHKTYMRSTTDIKVEPERKGGDSSNGVLTWLDTFFQELWNSQGLRFIDTTNPLCAKLNMNNWDKNDWNIRINLLHVQHLGTALSRLTLPANHNW